MEPQAGVMKLQVHTLELSSFVWGRREETNEILEKSAEYREEENRPELKSCLR